MILINSAGAREMLESFGSSGRITAGSPNNVFFSGTNFAVAAFKDASAGACMEVADKSHPAIGTGGGIVFMGRSDGSPNYTTCAAIHARKATSTLGQTGFGLAFMSKPDGGSLENRWQIDANGHFLPFQHISYDIGSSSNLIKTGWFNDARINSFLFMGGNQGSAKLLCLTSNNPDRGYWNPIWSALAGSRPLYNDEEFAEGYNSVGLYNNAGGTKVTLTRLPNQPGIPNASGAILRVAYDGTGTPGSNPTPGFGGVYLPITSSANRTFVQRILAKIPVGRNLELAENAQGLDTTSYWLTNQAGTGKWEQYIRVSHCGYAAELNFIAGVVTGGSGYAVNDILTAVGGTLYPSGVSSTVRVTAVSSGVITAVSIETPGKYLLPPASPGSPSSFSGGSGSGATITAYWSFQVGGHLYIADGPNTAFSWDIASINVYEVNASAWKYLNAENVVAGTLPSARLVGGYSGITGVGALSSGSIAAGFGSIVTAQGVSAGGIRATGGLLSSSGAGMELLLLSGEGTVQAYDRTSSQYLPMTIAGSQVLLHANGYGRWLVTSEGHFLPYANDSYDAGGPFNLLRSVYTKELNVSRTGQNYLAETSSALILANVDAGITRRVEVGYDTSADLGYFWAYHSGTALKPLLLRGSQVRFTSTDSSKGGVGIYAPAPDFAAITFDLDRTSGEWKAQDASAAIIYKTNDNLQFFGNSGLTVGQTVTPTARMWMDLGSGNLTMLGRIDTGVSLLVKRPSTATTGGNILFAELYQDDVSTTGVPNTYISLRFHHAYHYWKRIEARGDGFHFKDGDLATDIYIPIRASQLISTAGAGTSPFVVSSATRVDNLNAQYLSGIQLSGLVQTSVTVTGAKSVTGGGDLTANRTLELVNDAASPGANKYYGTDANGVKGFYDLP